MKKIILLLATMVLALTLSGCSLGEHEVVEKVIVVPEIQVIEIEKPITITKVEYVEIQVPVVVPEIQVVEIEKYILLQFDARFPIIESDSAKIIWIRNDDIFVLTIQYKDPIIGAPYSEYYSFEHYSNTVVVDNFLLNDVSLNYITQNMDNFEEYVRQVMLENNWEDMQLFYESALFTESQE